MTARHIVQSLTINLNQNQKQKLVVTVQNLSDLKLKQALISGVGYHHAGLIPETRHMVEELFRNNDLPVLVTTSTLALGVNLPAHLVIIKSTKCYSDRGFEDYSETALLQMVGRAGRPQFDVSAVALILTTNNDKSKFEKMIGGTQPIESNLHRNLIEHLNAEVVLRTITDLGVALEWLTSTYLYIRARKNPRFYGLPLGLTSEQIDKKLLEMCQIEINKLVKAGMMTINQNIVISPMQTGVIMARYCVAFDTMKLFQTIQGSEILQQILALISKCDEFKNDRLRVDDKRCLNLLNKNSTKQTIRFPLSGKVKTIDMKVNCIIQAILGCLDINNPSILADSHKILRHAERITHGLIEYLQTKSNNFSALLNTLILSKCFQAKLWENSPYVSKQLVGIGSVMSSYLVNAGKTSFATILESNPRELELIIKKRSLTGDRIIEQVQYLPKYEMSTKVVGESKLELRISLVNIEDLMVKSTVNRSSIMTLLVGDNLNRVLLHEKYMHSYMIENQEITKCIVLIPQGLEEVYVHFISADWVGFDCESKHLFTPEETPQFNNSKTVQEKPNPRLTQMFMDVYMKIKKNTPGKQRVVVQKKPEIEEQVNNIESISEKLDVTQSEQNEVLIDLTSKESNSIVSSLAEKYCSKSESLGQKIEFQSCRIKPNRIQVKPRVGKTVEDKIHHAMEFELNLYPQNTKPDLLNSTPKRKLSDDTSESIPETITECCLVKKRKPDEIPIEKLPKLVDLPGPSQSTTTELKPSFFGKLRPSQRGTKFQLCDEDSPENPTNIESLLDICSESFLETLGLLPPSKSQAANIPSVGDYYSQLVTRAKEKEEAKTCIVDSPTKEDELPIRFELPQSESLNSARYSPDIELDSFTVSPDENRDLVQVPYNFVHPQPNYVMQEPPHSSMGSYYNGFPNHFLHFNQSMVPPYDGSGAFGGYPGFQAYPGVYNSMYPFVVPPRSVLVPEEERYNNSVDKENVFVMRNFMRSLSGDDDDNYY